MDLVLAQEITTTFLPGPLWECFHGTNRKDLFLASEGLNLFFTKTSHLTNEIHIHFGGKKL